jgi:hypothetical protein
MPWSASLRQINFAKINAVIYIGRLKYSGTFNISHALTLYISALYAQSIMYVTYYKHSVLNFQQLVVSFK